MQYKLYAKLNSDFNIVDFTCNINFLNYNKNDILNANWLDVFIEPEERQRVFEMLMCLLGMHYPFELHESYDVKCIDGNHQFVDFVKNVIVEDDVKYIECNGILHHTANYFELLRER